MAISAARQGWAGVFGAYSAPKHPGLDALPSGQHRSNGAESTEIDEETVRGPRLGLPHLGIGGIRGKDNTPRFEFRIHCDEQQPDGRA